MKKNAILYTRVSSKEQVDEGNSLPRQKTFGYEYAEKNGFQILQHFEERGESAKTTDRTELKRMLEYIAHNRENIDALLIYRVDRLSRDTGDYLALKQLFEKSGIAVISMTEKFDDTPIGRVMETMASSFSQYDNEVRAERSRGGMIDGVKDGRWQWKAPIGYINTKVQGQKNIAPDPRSDYTDAIRNSWILIDKGFSAVEAREIVNKRLKELDIRTIPRQTFSSMLRKKVYKGVVCSFGLEVQSQTIAPIIESDIFDRVQGVLNGNTNQGKTYTKINPDFPLRGILFDKDGHKLTGSSSRGNGGVYSKYHCPKCTGKRISYDVMNTEEMFLDYVGDIELNKEIREALREAIKLNLGDIHKEKEKLSRELRKRLKTIKAEKREVTLKNIKLIVPDLTAQQILHDYEAEETKISLKLNEVDYGLEDAEEILEFGVNKLQNLQNTFESIEDISVRHKFQKWLFPAGLYFDGEKFGTNQLPLVLRVKKYTLESVFTKNAGLVTHPNFSWNQIVSELKELRSILTVP